MKATLFPLMLDPTQIKTPQIIMDSTFRLIVGKPTGNVNLVYAEGMKAPLSCLFRHAGSKAMLLEKAQANSFFFLSFSQRN
jgi:hypothetical protein